MNLHDMFGMWVDVCRKERRIKFNWLWKAPCANYPSLQGRIHVGAMVNKQDEEEIKHDSVLQKKYIREERNEAAHMFEQFEVAHAV